MTRTRSYVSALCTIALLISAGAVSAQEFRATVKGQVVDASQAALPGATVTVKNQETNELATATTNNEGNYTVPFLRPGLYTLTIEMSGFQTHTRKDMRFVYRKEFVAARTARPDEAVADLYRARGLSTDTEVEAGYLVYLGLGIVKALGPERHVRRVLIVGPGLDLAPRTALVEAVPPQSYQPCSSGSRCRSTAISMPPSASSKRRRRSTRLARTSATVSGWR